MHGFGMYGQYGGLGLIGMVLNLVITLGLIVGAILLVVWLVRRLAPTDGAGIAAPRDVAADLTPREILARRYARGEIDREAYQRMLQDLS